MQIAARNAAKDRRYVQRHVGHGNINGKEERERNENEVFVGGELR